MKNKLFAIASLSIIILLALVSFASAATLSATDPSTLPLTTGAHTFNIDVTGTIGETISFSGLSDITEDGKTITFTVPANKILAAATETVTVSYNVPSDFEFYFGKTYSTSLTATATSGNATQTISFKVNDPTEFENNGNLDLDLDISVKEGFGEDEEWYPMDEISVDVEVTNDGSDEIKNIVVEWGLYNTKNGDWIVNDEEKDFDLDDDDEKTLTITFQLDDVEDFEEDGEYIFYVWATGDDEETSNETSTYISEEIDMVLDDNFVVLGDIKISESASCGSEVQITADVWNIGDEEEEEVYVIIYNKELGINKKVVLGDIDAFDNAELSAFITIPENADEKTYSLQVSVYDEDNDIYENGNDDQSTYEVSLVVDGSCSLVPKVLITADLESTEVVAGKEFVIKATIINTGSKIATYNLGLSSYADWASLVSLDKEILTLDAAQSGEITIILKANKGASGEKTFDIVLTEGDKIMTQPVKVAVDKASLFPSLTGLVTGFGGDNWYLYGIGALNVLLVLIIIAVAIRVGGKKKVE
ncbi:putative S-layer protein [Candidatus Pacearchaeota archaeon]|nr:putative S-layer protein [Candidatus Pacearchaeota archaeon]